MFPKTMKMKNLNWIFIAVLLISAMLYAATNIHTASAQQTTPLVYVDPSSSVFTSPTVGTTFNVNVTVANVTGLAGAEFTLSWNASLLSCINMTENLFHTLTPSADWGNIWNLELDYNNTAGTASYAQTWMDLPTAEADGYAPANINTTTFPPDGSLAFVVLTFNITSVPGVNMFSECNFTLTSPVKLSNANANPIANTIVNGNYEVYGPPEVNVTSVSNPWTGITDNITTVTNATLVPDSMSYDNATYTLSFNVTGTAGTTGYVNVTVPTDIVSLNQTTDQWIVTVNGTQVTPIISSNATDTFFYITVSFDQGVPITITGTLPEFPTLMMIPLLATATMFAVVLRKRRRM
jgi:hypothetical protein